jgi:hypothetical protein
MVREAPFVTAEAAVRFDLPFVPLGGLGAAPGEPLAGDFGAVVFAIALFLFFERE